jgi:uncharacterized integral membrane protein
MAYLILIVALVIAVVTLVFAVANGTPVTVNLVFTQIPTQLSLAILVPFVAGVVVGLLVMVPGSVKNRFAIASHKRRIGALEKSMPKETPAPVEPPSDSQSS